MRFAAYNIEHFDRAFTNQNALELDHKRKSRDPLPQIEAVGAVLSEIDADLIGITEAPNTAKGRDAVKSTVTCLENFAAHAGLRARKCLFGFNAGTQEIAVLYDPDTLEVSHKPSGVSGSAKSPRFDEAFLYDADEDGLLELHRHDRPPLEARVLRKDGGADINLFVVHAKSKGIFNSVDLVNLERTSRKNRLRLFAQAASIRERVERLLQEEAHVVVMGDINDGPGMDEHEAKFGRSAVEIIMGDLFEPEKILRCYAGRPKWKRFGWEPSTTRFYDQITEDPINAMIDLILTSQSIRPFGGAAYKIWNPYEMWTKSERETDQNQMLSKALKSASDHFPVSFDFQ
ncbi:endonuclease/exonuclease/phosphatase family protein [Shimia sp. MMG029]|uniref:endonuclease/exonuclease/phosphatase family protein n=1 Tax=Shimia sp. MMG029 TaxID=3021978 RepID=UPI0022FE8FB1|nr:endonuclease/exonuclease/phosphatase family protein [Shimia sp. MMG029]MDA5555561.1 hypothetical protein [Shimia sp. MMG029]